MGSTQWANRCRATDASVAGEAVGVARIMRRIVQHFRSGETDTEDQAGTENRKHESGGECSRTTI